MTHALCSKSEIKIIDTQNQPNYDPREPKTILLNMSGVQGKPLGYVSDQTVEMCHQIVNNRFTKSNYYVKAVESDKHGENLLRGALHVNSYKI